MITKRWIVGLTLTVFASPILVSCVQPPEPDPPSGIVYVCDLRTREIITVQEDEADSPGYSRNLQDCDLPGTPSPSPTSMSSNTPIPLD